MFLAASAGVSALGTAPAAIRGMLLHLSCGAIGIRATQREAIDYAAKYGFDAVDANIQYLTNLSDGELQSLLDDMEAKKVSWGVAGLAVDFRRDDVSFGETLAAFPNQVAALRRAGVRRVTTWISPSSRERPYLQNFRLHSTRLRQAAGILDDNGLRLGLEYVGPCTSLVANRYPFIHTMAETRELVAEIGQPNVGLAMDSWHWYTAGDTRDDLLALRAQDVVSVDLNDAPAGIPVEQQIDSKRELPAATGVIDVKTFLAALEKIGFDGPVRVEPFNEAVRRMPPDQALQATITSLRKALLNG
ncbi:MAG TPA: sugar phosphate isomerase/epimerase family protein [Bryobacteraceae bacterium]|nr:sugar phosphate isomerase/epimerase family protein [Bryobacteraceae bacterium]